MLKIPESTWPYKLHVAASDFDPSQERDEHGRWTSGGASLYHDISNKMNDYVERKHREAYAKAAQYFKQPEVSGMKFGVTKNARVYGTNSGNRVYISKETLEKEHPAFVATVMKHEMEHAKLTAEKVPSVRQEATVRMRTERWASERMSAATNNVTRQAF